MLEQKLNIKQNNLIDSTFWTWQDKSAIYNNHENTNYNHQLNNLADINNTATFDFNIDLFSQQMLINNNTIYLFNRSSYRFFQLRPISFEEAEK
jgi:hypothetical protein